MFDKLHIMLGNFHIELAYYGALGAFVDGSGITALLNDSEVLAEGSVLGFLKGKFYIRCTRLHELFATAMERKLYERFMENLRDEERDDFELTFANVPEEPDQAIRYLNDPSVLEKVKLYQAFFSESLQGNFGPIAQYWTIYIFLVNRVHRELQRSVRTNDVEGYIKILEVVVGVYFALNRGNYARWATLFLGKMKKSPPRI